MATPPYAEIADLEERLGRDLSATETTRATSLLDTVSVYVDLNLSTCVDTIIADYPSIIVDVVANAVLRELAKEPNRDPDKVSVQLGEAAVTYRRDTPRGKATGPLTDDDLATLKKACGEGSVRGLGSVPITTTLHEMVKTPLEGVYVINQQLPEDIE